MSHVLFVCIQNAGRSQMAEALFTRDAGDANAVAMVTIPARADLQRHGYLHRVDYGRDDSRDERLVLQQRGTGPRASRP